MKESGFSELQRRIREAGKSQKALAAEIGISEWQLSRKLKEETDFRLGEINRISEALGLSDEEIRRCFFQKKK